MVQTVASTPSFEAARIYGYQLWELATSLSTKPTSVMGPENFEKVAECVRDARHKTIAAMRADLGLDVNVRPDSSINPFAKTILAGEYKPGQRPGPLKLGDDEESIAP